MCKQKPDWFIGAQKCDLEYIKQNLKKYKGTIDKRETDEAQGIYNGFGAIHYACMEGHLELVKLIVKDEILLETGSTVMFSAPGFSTSTKYKLAEGSTCLSIALLRKHSSVAKFLIDFLEQNKDISAEFVGHTNAMGLTTYIVASICKLPEAYEILRHPLFVKREFVLVVKGDITPVFNAAYFGRIETARVLEAFANRNELKEIVYEMLLQRDNGKMSAIDLAIMDVDLVKFDCTKEERAEIQRIILWSPSQL
ncbi:Ankyrin_repeat protein 1 [Hexamita inflata]|uniref:Ankyrin repeat protein 1 n=1 Tax=Hexamita inflata TaxID=28002 RepID=A0AA86UZX7_9EUKA|nr:Ankyrin repeat protein 1 [Hexamita inflata]